MGVGGVRGGGGKGRAGGAKGGGGGVGKASGSGFSGRVEGAGGAGKAEGLVGPSGAAGGGNVGAAAPMGGVDPVTAQALTADTVGGVFGYAIELCRALMDHGVEVSLATMGAPISRAQWSLLRTVPNVEVQESAYRLEWMDDPWEDVQRASEWLQELEDRTHPDVIHLNQFAFGAARFHTPTVVVGHSCVCSWFEAVKGVPAPPSFERYREVVTEGLARADRIVAPSRAMAAALEKHYPHGRTVDVIYNARAAGDWRPGEKAERIFAAGRLWDEAKNLSALVSVAPSLSWPVRLAGDATGPFANGFSGGAGVTLLGTLGGDAIARELSAASIYAFPAKYEPFGLSVLEAALSGCALVLGDIPSLRELWDGAALFVPPTDGDALASTLQRLIAAPSERAALGQAARAHAQRYAPARMTTAYLELYASLSAPSLGVTA